MGSLSSLRQDLLRRIKSCASSLTAITQRHNIVHTPTQDLSADFDNPPYISLSDPPISILESRLVEAGVPQSLKISLVRAFSKNAQDFKRYLEEELHSKTTRMVAIDVPGNRLGSGLHKKLSAVYVELYHKQLEEWISQTVSVALSRISNTLSSTSSIPFLNKGSNVVGEEKKKQAFNFEYVPLLEHFFNENAFPTHADKVFLAKKTGMTFQQIHVWFQNHRRRAKKDGHALRRKPMHEPPLSSFDVLLKRMGHRTIPEENREEYIDSESEYEWVDDLSDADNATPCVASTEPGSTDFLNITAPSHAFPTAYPPPGELDPFPVKRGIHTFPDIEWRRQPAREPVSHNTVDFDDFIEAFAKLNVREVSKKRRAKKQRPGTPWIVKPERGSSQSRSDGFAATAAITTRVSCAPSPALVSVTTDARVRPSPFPVTAVPAPASLLNTFEWPVSGSRPASLALSHHRIAEVAKPLTFRKILPLPRRVPTSRSSSRSTSPTSPPSPSHTLRNLSSESESCRSRSFSDSSSVSSHITTPESLPISLPDKDLLDLSLCVAGSDCELSQNEAFQGGYASQGEFLPAHWGHPASSSCDKPYMSDLPSIDARPPVCIFVR